MSTGELVSSKGERIKPKEGEIPRYNEFHGLWCIVGFRWNAARDQWAGACRVHTSSTEFKSFLFAFVFILAM